MSRLRRTGRGDLLPPHLGTYSRYASQIWWHHLTPPGTSSLGTALFSGLLELCQVVDVTVPIAERAAWLRARYGLRTPDALICATAIIEGCDGVLGLDHRWRGVREINFLPVD